MPVRKSLVTTLWLTSLLVLFLVAPVWASGFATVSSRPDCVRRNSDLPTGHPTPHLSSATTTDAVHHVSALPSEDEEQEREQDWADALYEPLDSFQIPCSFRKAFDRQLIAPLSILSLNHLRC